MKWKRDMFIPKIRKHKLEAPELGAEIYLYNLGDKPYAIGFAGRRQKPDWHYRFLSKKARKIHIRDYLENLEKSAEMKAKWKAERLAQEKAMCEKIQPGQILSTSWGYDQTNVEWFEVIKVKGHYAWIRELCASVTEEGFMQGTTKALPGQYAGPEMRKKITAYGVHIDNVRGDATISRKLERWCSWYH